jgi:hypothetical protein
MAKTLLGVQIAIFLTISTLQGISQQADSVTWEPRDLANGSPALFVVKTSATSAVSGQWQSHPLSFFYANNSWYALAGVDVEVAPGSYPLTIEIKDADGNPRTLHRSITLTAAPYKEVPLTVPEKFIQPDAEAQKTIAADKIVKDKVFAASASHPMWSGRFSPPLHVAPRTDSFGTRRVFNGSLASVHRGLDYRAKPGTPVAAVNAGRVVLARPLYYEGNCVIIDHGLGVMTLYMHLSKFKVAEGTQVKRGQVIALSGGTGRATGPHLHLGLRWQGAYLDPAKLYALDLPAPSAPH